MVQNVVYDGYDYARLLEYNIYYPIMFRHRFIYIEWTWGFRFNSYNLVMNKNYNAQMHKNIKLQTLLVFFLGSIYIHKLIHMGWKVFIVMRT